MVDMLIFIVSALSRQIVKNFVIQLIPSDISNIDIYKILISIIKSNYQKLKATKKSSSSLMSKKFMIVINLRSLLTKKRCYAFITFIDDKE